MIIIYQVVLLIIYSVFNVLIAAWNELIVAHRKSVGNTKQIEHPLWALLYAAVVSLIWFVYHSVFIIISLLLLHLSVFPVAYNLLTGQTAFHLSTTSEALTDRLMVMAGLKSTKYVNVSAFVISVGLLIIQFFL